MILDLSSLKKAIDSLERALKVASSDQILKTADADLKDTVRCGVIQNFEFTYELCWKFMKRWLRGNVGSHVEGVTRKELFRFAVENKLIGNVDDWMVYHDARNETAHTYDRAAAEEIFQVSRKFLNEARDLLKALEARND